MPEKMDPSELIRRYAAEASRIYKDRTAGDMTWEGLLYTLLDEIARSSEEEVK